MRVRVALAIAAVVVLGVAGSVLLLRERGRAPMRDDDVAVVGADSARTEGSAERVGVPPEHASEPDAVLPADPLGDEHNAWAAVDLEKVRAALPNNLYWKLSAPTKDPDLLRERQRERERWNVEYGKILSNTATEAEILAYYRERDRLYSDYIEFATYLFEHHGRDLSTRDLGLLKVAVELNLARLEEIPRQIAEANERRIAHQAAREDWLRDQAVFDEGAPPPRSTAR